MSAAGPDRREVLAMADGSEQPYVDPQGLEDQDLHLYETIITLEYMGRAVTRSEVSAAAGLSDTEADERLASLTERNLLVRSDARPGEPAFEPARRDWSAVPGEAAGPQRLT
jgi:hypothetical protein